MVASSSISSIFIVAVFSYLIFCAQIRGSGDVGDKENIYLKGCAHGIHSCFSLILMER